MPRLKVKGVNKKLIRIAVLVITLVYLVQFIPLNFLWPTAKTTIKNTLGYEIQTGGNIYLSILPTVKVYLNQVSTSETNEDEFQARKIIISPAILPLFSGELKISSIEFDHAKIKVSTLESGLLSATEIQRVVFKESSLDLPQDFFLGGKIDNLNAKLSLEGLLKKSIELDAAFIKNSEPYHIKTKFADLDKDWSSKESMLSISTSSYKVNFNGELFNLFTKPNFNGKAELLISNYPNPESKLQALTNKVLEVEDLKIMGDATLSDNKLDIKNIQVSSRNITNATGSASFLLGQAVDFSVNFDVSEINLDNTISNLSANNDLSIPYEAIVRNLIESFNFQMSPYITGDIYVSIKQILLKSKVLTNLNMVIDFFDSEISLSKLNVNLPGDSYYYMDGVIMHNGIRPRFDGNVALSINNIKEFGLWIGSEDLPTMLNAADFKLKSRVEVMPRNFRLYDIKAIYGPTYVLGKYTLKSTGERKMSTKLSLRFNDIDFDSYQLSNKFDQIIYDLFAFDNDKSGQYFLEHTKDFKWLREFPINLNMELDFDKIKFKTKEFSKVMANFRVQPNKIFVDEFKVDDTQLPLEFNGSFLLTALNPEINLNLKFKQLDPSFLGSYLPSYVELQNYQQNYFKGLAERRKENQIQPENFYSKDINLFSSHNFFGNFILHIDSLKSPHLSGQDIELKAALNEGNIQITSFTGKMFGGSFNVIGNLSNLSSKVNLSSSFAFNNFNPEEFFEYFYGTPMLRGYFSASGNLTGSGQDWRSLFSSSNGSISVLGKKFTVKSFGLGELIRLTEIKVGKSKTDEALKYYASKGQTVFDDLKATINIKNGIANLSDVNFSNNRATGVFVANCDIVSWQINGLGKISFYPMSRNYPLVLDLNAKGDLRQEAISINVAPLEMFLTQREKITQQQP